jgi:hypothetical protein
MSCAKLLRPFFIFSRYFEVIKIGGGGGNFVPCVLYYEYNPNPTNPILSPHPNTNLNPNPWDIIRLESHVARLMDKRFLSNGHIP